MPHFDPWHRHTDDATFRRPEMSVEELHDWVLEGLKSQATYPFGHQVASQFGEGRVPAVDQTVLVCVEPQDILAKRLPDALRRLPGAESRMLPDGDDCRARVVSAFLAQPPGAANGESALEATR